MSHPAIVFPVPTHHDYLSMEPSSNTAQKEQFNHERFHYGRAHTAMSNPAIFFPVPIQDDYMSMDPDFCAAEDEQFNPSSYTHCFHGSPTSWQSGSFDGHFNHDQLSTALPVSPVNCPKSYPDSPALGGCNIFDSQSVLSNFKCCDASFTDLHALFEHFEEVHIVLEDRSRFSTETVFSPRANACDQGPTQLLPPLQLLNTSNLEEVEHGAYYDIGSVPPITQSPVISWRPTVLPPSTGISKQLFSASLSRATHPFFGSAPAPLDARAVPFSAYALHNAKHSIPSAVTLEDVAEYCAPPNPLVPDSVFVTSNDLRSDCDGRSDLLTTTNSRAPRSPTSKHIDNIYREVPSHRAQSSTSIPESASRASPLTCGPQGLTLGLQFSGRGFPVRETTRQPNKAFRCPKPNCLKSYKQIQGLRYHIRYGSCSYRATRDSKAALRAIDCPSTSATGAPPDIVGVPSDPTDDIRFSVLAPNTDLRADNDLALAFPNPISPSVPITSSNDGVKLSEQHRPAPYPVATSASRLMTAELGCSSIFDATTLPIVEANVPPRNPFRCPKPKCSKSYKQAHGLEYHLAHGSCNYGPAKDVEIVRTIISQRSCTSALSVNTVVAPKRPQRLTHSELNEFEVRICPFACGVTGCTRRYKTKNGLRYHYKQSDAHCNTALQSRCDGIVPMSFPTVH
ncbi:hypothetical protein K438DRAFT_1754346 [Mycena galopus ATCC 62051]|nr:hypothetical protein K438DRAFT_1754346 [Mycena galopus ATCC 62051]